MIYILQTVVNLNNIKSGANCNDMYKIKQSVLNVNIGDKGSSPDYDNDGD